MLTFNLLLKGVKIDPKDVYLVRHKDTRTARGILRQRGSSPYQLWATQKEKFEIYQQIQARDCFGRRKWIASFVASPANETLFVGMYQNRGLDKFPKQLRECPVRGIPVNDRTHFFYDLVRSGMLSDWAGRITIDWGGGFRAWIQKADREASGDKQIRELRTSAHELPFPGFREFRHDLATIKSIWPSWQAQLKAKGIYLLTCKDHGEQYVGKADGEDGLWGRLCTYSNGHGGNKGMKPHTTSGYMVSILEATALAMGGDLGWLEEVWKTKLSTKIWGLNKN